MASARTAATLPSGKYSRPPLTDDTNRRVTFTDEDSRCRTFEFTDVEAHAGLVDDLVDALAAGAASDGRWRTIATVDAAAKAVRQLASYLMTEFPEVRSAADIGPEVWWAWRSSKDQKARWPGQVNLMRALLSESPKLPETTRRAMRARAAKPRRRLPENDSYSRAEFSRIRNAAKAQVRQADQRLESNSRVLQNYLAAGSQSDGIKFSSRGVRWTTGSLLEYLSRNGELPSLYLAKRVVLKGCFDLRGVSNPAQALFPSIREIYCLMALLVCERGFNLSVMDNLTMNSFQSSDIATEAPVHTIEIDKPRRGAKRHGSEILAGDAGKLWERAVTLTRPCREALEALGAPTDKLLVAHRNKNLTDGGPFRTDWSEAGIGDHYMADLGLSADDGARLRVCLRRLRLSEQVLNQHARQNSEAVSEDVYRNPDRSTAERASVTIVDAQAEAVAHARATLSVRSMSAAEVAAAHANPESAAAKLGVPVVTLKLILAGKLDTPTAACVDFRNSPFAREAGEPCPASFFACLACRNSVVTPEHLPRLVTLRDALDNIAAIVPAIRWEADYSDHYTRLTSLIGNNATSAEIETARRSATDAERELIGELLGRNLDA
jgi:hypothetical protein